MSDGEDRSGLILRFDRFLSPSAFFSPQRAAHGERSDRVGLQIFAIAKKNTELSEAAVEVDFEGKSTHARSRWLINIINCIS
jgi:hypothetical protein